MFKESLIKKRKKMKHLILITMMLFTSLQTMAQLTPEEAADYQNDVMEKELNLTEEQKEAVGILNLEFSKKQMDLINAPGSMFGKIGDMRKIKSEKTDLLSKILTKEQMKKYEDDIEPALRKYMRSKMKS